MADALSLCMLSVTTGTANILKRPRCLGHGLSLVPRKFLPLDHGNRLLPVSSFIADHSGRAF